VAIRGVVTECGYAARSDDTAVRAEASFLTGDSVAPWIHARALAGTGLARERLGDVCSALRSYDEAVAETRDPLLRFWTRDRVAKVESRLAREGTPCS
jgi:hypothetical protein